MAFPNVSRLAFATFLLTILTNLNLTYCENFIYKSYQNSAICSASEPIQYPDSKEALKTLILRAKASGTTVKVVGKLYSVTDMICTTGIPVSLQNIKQDMKLSTDTVTVGAGEIVKDVLDFLLANGKSLIHVPICSGGTIGGSISDGSHGSSLRHPGSLSDQVVALTVMNAEGVIYTIDDPTELQAYRVHLGLLGVIVTVTLKIVPSFKMRVHNYVVDESVLLNGTALDMAKERDWFQIYWFPNSQEVVFSEGNYISADEEGNAETNFIPDLKSDDITAASLAFENMQKDNNLAAQYAFEKFAMYSLYKPVSNWRPYIFSETDSTGKKIFKNPAVGWAYKLQSSHCSNTCAWDNGKYSVLTTDTSISVQVDKLPQVVEELREIFSKIPAAFVLVGIMMRFSKKSDALLSMSADWDTVSIEFPNPKRYDPYTDSMSALGALQSISQTLMFKYNGRAHWGKNGLVYSTKKVIEQIPETQLTAFYGILNTYDPYGLFINNFGNRVRQRGDVLTIPPQFNELPHCALEDYCKCQESEDCAKGKQFCGKFMKKYSVCQDKKSPELPAVIPKPEVDYNPLNFTDIIRCFLPEVYSLLKPALQIVDDLTDGIL